MNSAKKVHLIDIGIVNKNKGHAEDSDDTREKTEKNKAHAENSDDTSEKTEKAFKLDC